MDVLGSLQEIANMKDLRKTMELLQLKEPKTAARTAEEARQRKYEFWDTQPVPKLGKLMIVPVFFS